MAHASRSSTSGPSGRRSTPARSAGRSTTAPTAAARRCRTRRRRTPTASPRCATVGCCCSRRSSPPTARQRTRQRLPGVRVRLRASNRDLVSKHTSDRAEQVESIDEMQDELAHDDPIEKKVYERDLEALQIELLKAQRHIKSGRRPRGHRVRGSRRRRQGRRDQAVPGAPEPPRRPHRRPAQAHTTPSGPSGTSSATSPTCRRPARSRCSTAPGTTAPASRR